MDKSNYRLVPVKHFSDELTAMSDTDQKMVGVKLCLLAENPFYPSLRTKKLNGRFGYYESSVNMNIRIIWEFADDVVSDIYRDANIRIISLLDVGHHDVLKKY